MLHPHLVVTFSGAREEGAFDLSHCVHQKVSQTADEVLHFKASGKQSEEEEHKSRSLYVLSEQQERCLHKNARESAVVDGNEFRTSLQMRQLFDAI